jgi:hypothetical protein
MLGALRMLTRISDLSAKHHISERAWDQIDEQMVAFPFFIKGVASALMA